MGTIRSDRPNEHSADYGAIDDQLRSAIANKRLIQVGYVGSLRIVEPHDYGVQKGVTRLLVYQRRGPSRSQRTDVRGWRLFDLSKIESCAILEETFRGSRGTQHTDHRKWDVLYARVG